MDPDTDREPMTDERSEEEADAIDATCEAPPAPRIRRIGRAGKRTSSLARHTRHPTHAQVDEVARTFERLAEAHPGARIATDETGLLYHDLTDANTGGISACHGGWYALHALRSTITFEPLGTPRGEHLFVATVERKLLGLFTYRNHVTYEDGARAIAQALGFRTPNTLASYYDAHPHLWGNEHAWDMFESSLAFGVARHVSLTLEHIGTHWRAVAARTENAGAQTRRRPTRWRWPHALTLATTGRAACRKRRSHRLAFN